MTVRTTVLAVALVGAVAGPRAAAADLPPNAAVKYWTAFGLLPKLDKDQEKLLDDPANAPEAATKALFEPLEVRACLTYLHRAAAIPQCDWALNMEDGVYLHLPHLGKARELARLASLRARLHFAAGRTKEGIDDALAVVALARRIGQEPTTMIGVLVEFVIERIALDALATALPKLTAADRAAVAAGLQRFPPAGNVRACLKSEKTHYVAWMVAKLRATPAAAMKEELARMSGPPEEEIQKVRELLKPLSNEEVLRQLDAMGGVYDEFNQLLEQPRDQFAAGWDRLKARVKAQMPLTATILPAVEKVIEAQERQEAHRALFRAALAVADGGPDRLKDPAHRDPFGTGPFEYSARPQGFELRSKLVFRGEPVKLVAGPAQ